MIPLHRVFICDTHVLPKLRQFWGTFRTELADEGPHPASIGSMRLRLQELQEEDVEAQGTKAGKFGKGSWEGLDGVLHHQGLP